MYIQTYYTYVRIYIYIHIHIQLQQLIEKAKHLTHIRHKAEKNTLNNKYIYLYAKHEQALKKN